MRHIIGRPIAVVAAALIVAAATTGIATGAIPSTSDGVIHACHEKPGLLADPGDLRVIDNEAGQSCRSNETALTWNQQGPQGEPGPQGPQGEPGPQGPEGDPGPASLAEVVTTRQPAEVPFSGPATTIRTLAVPGGKYLVQATLTVRNVDTTPISVHVGSCQLTRGENLSVVQSIASMFWTNDGYGNSDVGALSVSLQGAVALSGATNLRVRCASNAEGSRLAARDIVITATRIGTINGS